jgi:hypothetical protein
MHFNTVVFPDPELPMMRLFLQGLKLALMPLSTSLLPNDL